MSHALRPGAVRAAVLVTATAALLAGCNRLRDYPEPVASAAPPPELLDMAVVYDAQPASVPDRVTGSLSEDRVVHFAYDQYRLSGEELARLQPWVRDLQLNPDVALRLSGHTDDRGTREYNVALGERRARSVHDFFVLNGIAADRLEVVSYGEEKPVDAGDDEQARANNRRVELDLTAP